MSDINFLVVKNREVARKQKGVKALRIIAVLSLLTVGLLSLLSFYATNRIYPKSLKSQYDLLLKNMSTLHSKEAKLAIINNRIENISDIFGKKTTNTTDKGSQNITEREDYSKVISKFSDKMSAGIKIDSLKVDKKIINIILSSNSLLPINGFIDGLTDLGRDKTVKALTLDSLSVSEATGTYSLSLTASL